MKRSSSTEPIVFAPAPKILVPDEQLHRFLADEIDTVDVYDGPKVVGRIVRPKLLASSDPNGNRVTVTSRGRT